MVRHSLALMALLAASPLPAAAQPAQHSIPWFMQNPAARQRTIAACRDDYRYAAGRQTASICANAEAAETRLYARQMRAFSHLDRPEFWQGNVGMMAALRTACVRRAPYDRMMLRYCRHAG